ncbi:MAG TPA: glycosyltransferase family 39 protein [Myxococcota bacterium]|nr:glycosyltransferase family 39 protein [Myxococcota bacterium]HRY94815.1 glycosyltransferase family 39 protein [Myxococcota bacterium]HSA22299.1 glycosyltransferase family 39 protein [Myxococcota bacterium]
MNPGPSQPRADNRPVWALGAALLALTGLRLWLAASLELSPDEAYYWVWSQHLQPGYFDHPPAVAWLIRASTALFGRGELAVRLPAVLLGLGTAWMVFLSGRRLLGPGGAGPAAWIALLASLCPLLTVGAVIHTPDAALAFSWSLAVWAALGALERDRPGDWALLGLAVGLAGLAKASGLVLLPGLGLYLTTCAAGRAHLRRPGPAIAVLTALVVLAPGLWWDLGHAGGALVFQARHAAGGLGLRPLGALEFLAGQAGVVSPLLWAGLVAFAALGWRREIRNRRPPAYLLWCLAGPWLLGLTLLSGLRPVEANWPAPAYLAALPGLAWAAGGGLWFLRRQRLWLALALGLAFASSAAVQLQAVAPWMPLGPERDPTERLRGWQVLAAQAVADADALGAGLAAEGYGPVSLLRYYSGREVSYEPSSARRSQYDLWPPVAPADPLLVLQPLTSRGPPGLCAQTRSRWRLQRDPRGVEERKLGQFRFWVCEGFPPAGAGEVEHDGT